MKDIVTALADNEACDYTSQILNQNTDYACTGNARMILETIVTKDFHKGLPHPLLIH